MSKQHLFSSKMNISNFIAQRYFFLSKKHISRIFGFLILCPLIFIAEFYFIEFVGMTEGWQKFTLLLTEFHIAADLQALGLFVLPCIFTYYFFKNAFKDLKLNLVNILSGITILLVAVGAMSLVIVLSVFNGLEDLTRNLHANYNPELKITIKKGKSFDFDTSIREKIEALPEVLALTRVIEDNALLRYEESQMAVKLKGVEDNFGQQYNLKQHLREGNYELHKGSIKYALLGWGVQSQLSVSMVDEITPLIFWYPKKGKKIITNPLKAFDTGSIMPGGVLAIDQQFDKNNVIVPIDFAEELMRYRGKITSLEIKSKTAKKADIQTIKSRVEDLLGDKFLVQNSEEQQAIMLRAFKIERLFTFTVFVLILGLASFNIFFTLAILVVEKKHHIAILKAMGASKSSIQTIFLIEGALIAFWGTAIGLFSGFVLGFIQETYAPISIGIDSAIQNAYPLRLAALDFVWVAIAVVFITLSASIIPALNAKKVTIRENIAK